MIYTIPTSPTTPRYRQRTTLDGRTYVLGLEWVDRDDAWHLSISDVEDVPIATGIRVVTDWPLLRRVTDPRRPPGEILVLGPGAAPGWGELGDRYELVYLDAETMEAYR